MKYTKVRLLVLLAIWTEIIKYNGDIENGLTFSWIDARHASAALVYS